MLLSLALLAATSVPAEAPHVSIAHAGFLRDARAELRADHHLVFDARLQWPATVTRTSFVVEALSADGAVLYSHPVSASARTAVGRHKRSVAEHFDLELPALEGVQQLRVRLAR
ncbi:MAG: hypothetical protein IPJ19_08125 [Planctomycetes bacterium]|nr:hypothetical protein [Planctomycetota bacterium]